MRAAICLMAGLLACSGACRDPGPAVATNAVVSLLAVDTVPGPGSHRLTATYTQLNDAGELRVIEYDPVQSRYARRARTKLSAKDTAALLDPFTLDTVRRSLADGFAGHGAQEGDPTTVFVVQTDGTMIEGGGLLHLAPEPLSNAIDHLLQAGTGATPDDGKPPVFARATTVPPWRRELLLKRQSAKIVEILSLDAATRSLVERISSAKGRFVELPAAPALTLSGGAALLRVSDDELIEVSILLPT